MAEVVLVLGNDISTDAIYPGRYMATVLPTETPQYAFADNAEFNRALNAKQMPPGSVIVAGDNFGCGSSRKQAVSALRGHGLVVIARGFARIFLQNAINVGLKIVVAPEVEASAGDQLEILPGRIENRTSGRSFVTRPLPAARQAIINVGGLVAYTRQKLSEERRPRG